MNFGGAGFAEQSNDVRRRSATDDAVVDDNQFLSANYLGQGVELLAHSQVTQVLLGFDEGPADVAVLDQSVAVRDARLVGVADGGGDGGVRDSDDEVCFHRVFPGQLGAHVLSDGVNQGVVHHTVRAGEVDQLEDAQSAIPSGPLPTPGAHPVPVYDDGLSGFDLADQVRSQVFSGAGLGGNHPAAVKISDAEGANTQGVAHGDYRIYGEGGEGKGPFQDAHAVESPVLPGLPGCIGEKVGYKLGIGGSREGAVPPLLDMPLDLGGVDDVAVVGQRHPSVLAVYNDGLGVGKATAAGGGVARVPDGQLANERCDVFPAERLGDQAHVGVEPNAAVVGSCDAGAFLAAVLKGE